MILEVAGMLTLAGFVTWILGSFFEYTEIAVIGGTIVVAVGGMIALGGLEYRTGETHVAETNTTTNTTTTQISYQFEDVPLPTQFPGGVLLMVVGGMLAVRPMGEEGGIM